MKILVRKSFLLSLGALALSTFLVLALIEASLRIIVPTSTQTYSQGNGIFCRQDPTYGWLGIPGVEGQLTFPAKDMSTMKIWINSEGFIDTEHSFAKPHGIKRILFLGDSFTAGFGVPVSQRFSDLVSKELGEKYEVINMGLWGYSTDQELLILEDKGLKYHPDIIVLAVFMDDYYGCQLHTQRNKFLKPKFSYDTDGNIFLRGNVPNNNTNSYLVNFFRTRFALLCERMSIDKNIYSLGWISVFDNEFIKRGYFKLPLLIMSAINNISERNNSRLLVVLIPFKDQLRGNMSNLPQTITVNHLKRSNAEVLDLLPVYKQSNEKLYFSRDLHWTASGHQLASRLIVKKIQDLDRRLKKP